MDPPALDPELAGTLAFLRGAEALKRTSRTAWASDGRRESVAEHTWRLCLMAVVLADRFDDVDPGRLLKMCVVHDLGEALGGDVSAVDQDPSAPKAAEERADLVRLLEPLPGRVRAEILALWDEYEGAATAEARAAKALDKLETILQHNQGANPADFDYAFNLGYGARYTRGHPAVEALRAALDEETAARARESGED